MPRSYAASRRAGESSPPAASRPSGSASAVDTSGNQVGSASSPSQTMPLTQEPLMNPRALATATLFVQGQARRSMCTPRTIGGATRARAGPSEAPHRVGLGGSLLERHVAGDLRGVFVDGQRLALQVALDRASEA